MFRVVMKRKERRRAARLTVNEQAVLIVPGEMEMEAPARLMNYSTHGLAVRSRYPVKVGSRVIIQTGAIFFVGRVRRCQPLGEEFDLGLLLDDTADNERSIQQLAATVAVR